MKVPLSWLRELVELDMPLPELRQRLTAAWLRFPLPPGPGFTDGAPG